MVALGDSITAAKGSWASLLAQRLGLQLVSFARDGAVVADVLDSQLPRVHGRHDLACLYAGVNDARSPGFDPERYERDLHTAAAALAERADALLLCTLPLDLGRPPATPKPAVANAAVRRVAGATGAIVCELDDLAGPVLLEADAVHPTSAGQRAIADRAAAALDGSPTWQRAGSRRAKDVPTT
jgi:lysophospholipase L1-like esterase